MRQEIEKMIKECGFVQPARGLDGYLNADWKDGKPDFNKADLAYFKGKTKHHPSGSLEMTVENLVKQWEMEMTHLPQPKDWKTIQSADSYTLQINCGRQVKGVEAAKMGTYNVIMENAPKHLYDAQAETFETSHKLFRGAFRDGFPWEVIEVFSAPPKVAFSWHHWGVFNGDYKEVKGNGATIRLTGFAIANLSVESKIVSLEVYTKFDDFLQALQGGQTSTSHLDVISCPMHK